MEHDRLLIADQLTDTESEFYAPDAPGSGAIIEKWQSKVAELEAVLAKYRAAAEYAEDLLNPETDPRSSGMALHKLCDAIAFDKALLGQPEQKPEDPAGKER
jgi:hypothetical protein